MACVDGVVTWAPGAPSTLGAVEGTRLGGNGGGLRNPQRPRAAEASFPVWVLVACRAHRERGGPGASCGLIPHRRARARWWEQTFLRSGCCLASSPCSRWGACQRFPPRGSGHTCVPVWPGRALRLPNALAPGQGLGTQVRSLHPLAPPESMFLGFVFEHFSELATSLFLFPLVRTTVPSCGHGGALGSCLRSCWTFYAQPPTRG